MKHRSPSLLSSRGGVALVVTLIMLSIITVTAVAFLALSRHERAGVTQTINLTDARYMSDNALERAKGQIGASVMATTNMLNGNLAVSRTFMNPNGFDPSLPPGTATNVNYEFLQNGAPLTLADLYQNIANLQIDPRAPVFVRTNRLSPGVLPTNEFRFYVDLNRNGRFEANGFLLPYDDAGRPIGTNFFYFVGDPEWIGVLEKPNLPHGANNRFIGRYAYLILPVGKSLDLNFIHNQSQTNTLFGVANRGRFYRDQGFGTYEINLAAFLAALNTNTLWFTNYYYGTNGICTGEPFLDALDLVQYRYAGEYTAADTVSNIFGFNAPLFTADRIDGLARAVDTLPPFGPPDDLLTHAWPGASSRQHFYSVHDFFNRSKFPPYTNFIDRLTALLAKASSYDRYTYYRLLSQMGTDSAEEPAHADISNLIAQISAQKPEEFLADTVGRINLNYDNITPTYAASDFVNWDPLTFFTNVGNILLREQFPFGITNIPVSPTNVYPVSVQRLLQQTANIYDAATTDWFPTVFLPLTGKVKQPFTNALTSGITGYTTNLNQATALLWAATNDFGLPAIIGAKKYLPNFNEFVFQTFFQITRKLEVSKLTTNGPPTQTNQIMLLSVSNLVAVENWNSYSTAFSNDFQVYVTNIMSCILSNAVDGFTFATTNYSGSNISVSASTNQAWHFRPAAPATPNFLGGFGSPLFAGVDLLTNSRYNGRGFDNLTNSYPNPRTGQLPVSDWSLIVSNRMTYVVSSPTGPAGKVLDLVSFSFQTNLSLTELLLAQNTDITEPAFVSGLWDTNRISSPATPSTPTEGIMEQLRISLGQPALSDADWKSYNGTTEKPDSITTFQRFVGSNAPDLGLFQQAPFTATRRLVHTVTWQANDPLVHYMLEDMGGTTNQVKFLKPGDYYTNSLNLGRLNQRYQPWLGNPNKDSKAAIDPTDAYVGTRDPGVFGSDDWDFPSQKLPSIGWLGRVHRGTPWQTVYLKAEVASPSQWLRQSPDLRTHATNDWRLLDIFTVAQIPNASHGQLSINQSGLAAWTAVLGSLTVLSNAAPNLAKAAPAPSSFIKMLIEPTTNAPVIQGIVDAINRARQQRPNQVFRSLGELLSVPELTTKSPFINLDADPATGFSAQDIQEFSFTDEAYERIPRQILSLLKVGDARYVIYAFGQSLKPADKSIITSAGPYFGMCTNYQITGEVFTRTLMKLEGNARNPQPRILNFNILPAD